MSGTCPFAAYWPRAEAVTAKAAGATPEAETGPTPATEHDAGPNVTSTSTSARSCPAGFGAGADRSWSSSGGSRACPLGFGGTTNNTPPSAASFASGGLPRMSLGVLAGHRKGGVGNVALVSVKGVVFNVSKDTAFQAGGALARAPGHDASRLIAVAGADAAHGGEGGDDGDLDAGLGGLRYEDHQRLESFFVQMLQAGHTAVAVLADEDHERIFGAPLCGPHSITESVSTDQAAPPSSPSMAAKLHAFVEQGDAEAVKNLLLSIQKHNPAGDDRENDREDREPRGTTAAVDSSSMSSSHIAFVVGETGRNAKRRLIDCLCPRTGMTPLLKAVEGASEEVVRLLLEAGADVRSQAALYDGDDAIALARRLGSRDAIVEMLRPYALGEGGIEKS